MFTNTLTALTSVASTLVSKLSTISVDGKAIKVYGYDPGLTGESPVLMLTAPDLIFPAVDEAQRQMGSYDVGFGYNLFAYVKATDLNYAHATIIKLLSQVVDVIEESQTLDGVVEDIRVTAVSTSFIFPDTGGSWMLAECQLNGYLFIEQ